MLGNFSEQQEHMMKPHIMRGMPKDTAVVIHCERGHRRKLLPPIEPDDEVCKWFEIYNHGAR